MDLPASFALTLQILTRIEKMSMKYRLFVALVLAGAVPALSNAEDVSASAKSLAAPIVDLMPTAVPPTLVPPSSPVVVVTPSPSPQLDPMHLKGKRALGLSFSPNDSTLANVVGQTLSFRYWLKDNLSLELLAGYGSLTTPNTGNVLDVSGNLYFNSYQSYRGGLGLKTNIAQPYRGIFIQSILTGFYTSTQSTLYANPAKVGTVQPPALGRTNSATLYDAYTGLGFEAFIPFWPALSVEGSVGLVWDMRNDVQYDGTTASSYALNSMSSGLNPLNGSVHFHF